MKKFLKSKLILILLVVVMLFGVVASLSIKVPAMASTSCGQVLVKASDWLGGHGVDVRSNGADMNTGNECNPDGEVYKLNANPPQYGFGWVCVELVNRLYVTKGWSARLTIPATYNGQKTYEGAKWLYTLAAAGYYLGLVAHANGSNYTPVPGDMIVHSNGTYGHVTVVDHISGNALYAVDQNRSPNGWESYAYNSSTGAVSMSGVPISGYVHSTKNTSTGGSGVGTANIIKNGDFSLGGTYWSRTGSTTNFSVLTNSGGTTPYEGNQYMASNTQDAGGSVYQDVPLTINSGDTICARTMLTTYGAGSGSSGNVTLWINGQGSGIQYSNLPGNNVWTPYKVCNTASSSASSFRFQIYPGVGSPTVGVDTIDANKSFIKNGDFGLGGNYWSRFGNSTNFSVLTNSGGTTPYEGNQYMASNTQDAGGSVYQDIPLTISSGDTICARTMLTTYGTGSGSSGYMYLWVNGQSSSIRYSNLPGNNIWTPYEVCVTASSAASTFRYQIYPDVGSPTVGVDTIDANKSAVKNGDFSLGGNNWSRFGSTTNFSVLTNSGGTTPYEGNQYMASNTQDAGGSVYQDVPLTINTGDTICASVMLTTYGTGSGSSGYVYLWVNSQSSSIRYSNLPGNNVWTPYRVCNTASKSASSFRFQIYPDVGAPTVGVDTIDDGM